MNIACQVWARADQGPDRPATRCDHATLTHSPPRAGCGPVAPAVLQVGERVVLLAPTVVEFPITHCGLQAAGLTVIKVNPTDPGCVAVAPARRIEIRNGREGAAGKGSLKAPGFMSLRQEMAGRNRRQLARDGDVEILGEDGSFTMSAA